ncbi:MAG: transposase, partial [Nitrospirota bacterium]|nr:transposase [Nitrospirota bacterium]
EQLQTVLTRIITRLLKMLTRKGALTEEDTEIPYLANPDADPALAPLHAAACTYRIALGPRAGQKVLTWKDPSLRLASPEVPHPQGCVSAQGFSLHADTQCGPQQRQKLERLCRYITRPALGHKGCAAPRPARSCFNSKPRTGMAPPISS